MHNTYGKIYSGLIDSVRSNQHAFSNHLTAIKAMLYRVSDEDARDEIEKYVSEVLKVTVIVHCCLTAIPYLQGFCTISSLKQREKG